jgi:Fur family peroxide stress response transcriptional regulator
MDTRATTPTDLREALDAAGHRYTPQRAAVFRYLRQVTHHPTADEIFTAVRNEIPDISLATVYKALEALVSAGLARKVTLGDGPARYDGRTDAHDHFRCLGCGAVVDLDHCRDPEWARQLERLAGFEVVDVHLEVVGYCPACRS